MHPFLFFNTVIESCEFSCPFYARLITRQLCLGRPRAEKQVAVMLFVLNILISCSTQGGVYIHDDRLSVSSPVLMWIKVRINLLFAWPVLSEYVTLWICLDLGNKNLPDSYFAGKEEKTTVVCSYFFLFGKTMKLWIFNLGFFPPPLKEPNMYLLLWSQEAGIGPVWNTV